MLSKYKRLFIPQHGMMGFTQIYSAEADAKQPKLLLYWHSSGGHLRCVARSVYAALGQGSAKGAWCVARGMQAEGLRCVARAVLASLGELRPYA